MKALSFCFFIRFFDLYCPRCIVALHSYSASGWKDLLTNFNGDSIIYDEIGNPTRYRDGMTFDWESGRRLASITKGTNSYSYSYDSSGVRISKTVNGTTYSYIYDNGQLIYADTPLGGMTFFYENDSVVGLSLIHISEPTRPY